MTERTFIMVKPDGVQRRLVGEIVRRFEARGFRLLAMKMLTPDRKLAEAHYAVHRERPFFQDLVQFITSGPVVATVWEGDDAVRLSRATIGATRPAEALPGTIRGDLTLELQMNLVHGSDSPETAEQEIALWFRPEEVAG